MSKINQISMYNEATKKWSTPVDIGAKAGNVELMNDKNLEDVIGDYTSTISIADKLKYVGNNSAIEEAYLDRVSVPTEIDTSKVITGSSDVDITSGDSLKTCAEKYNVRGIRINNKFEDYIPKSNIVSDIKDEVTNEKIPSSLAVYNALQLSSIFINSAAVHRNIYRGINLIGVNAPFSNINDLASAVAAQDFKNIFIGDYFDISLPATTISTTQTVRLIVADINYYLKRGSISFTNPHLILMPYDCLEDLTSMNENDTASDGYANSKLHTTILSAYAAAFKSVLGNKHVFTHKDLLTTTIANDIKSCGYQGLSGAASGYDWFDVTLRLPNENMIYGTSIWGSSAYDTGCASQQLAAFALNPELYVKKQGYSSNVFIKWWLSSIANTTSFTIMSETGTPTYCAASENCGIVPVIIFG